MTKMLHIFLSDPKRICTSLLTSNFLSLLDQIRLAFIYDETKASDLVFFAGICSMFLVFYPIWGYNDLKNIFDNIHF